jgi:hypothetical protein
MSGWENLVSAEYEENLDNAVDVFRAPCRRPLNFSGAPESDRCRIYCDSPLITIKRAQQTGSCSWLTTRTLQK